MATSPDVASLYSTVIRTVIQEVRQDFINMGVDEQALFDLQAIWEQKLLASKVFQSADYPSSNAQNFNRQDFGNLTGNFAYQPEGFGQNPGRGPVQGMPFNNYGYAPQPVRLPAAPQRYPAQMAPQMFNPTAPLQRPGQSNTTAPTTDSSGTSAGSNNQSNIPQYDGADDDSPPESAVGSDESGGAPVPIEPKPVDELGSDLDDDDDESNEEEEIDDLLLCLYEKVNRTRNKWKCNFKSGIIHLAGRDFAFTRLNGDFEW